MLNLVSSSLPQSGCRPTTISGESAGEGAGEGSLEGNDDGTIVGLAEG
jgi:hypothetical protein